MSNFFSDYIHKGIRPLIRGAHVDGLCDSRAEESESSSEEEGGSKNEYVKEFVRQELQMYATYYKEDTEANVGGLTGIDDVTNDLATSEIRSEVYRMARMPEIYKNYNFETTFTKRTLTIDSYKEKILNIIKTNSAVIIQGPTGCGKTTQVPQYILDDCRASNKDCNIVITQPRKIATINVARRVCQERGWTLGTVCGYQIGLQKELGPDCILSYMTTGVLLQKLIYAKHLLQFTHIIVDEVHERNQELDFLLLIIRKLLFTNSLHTKVILMSATIDANEFAYYFRCQTKSNDLNAPIVVIQEPAKPMFKTTTFYLDQLQLLTVMPEFDKHKPEIHEGVWDVFLYIINVFGKLDDIDLETNTKTIGSVLVFLPGIREIEEAEKLLKAKEDRSNPIRWHIVPLHSSLPNDEQSKAFDRALDGQRKIILSTNLAESSITVPDITYVIDFCLTKVMTVDRISKFSSLQLEWAAHVNCDQRKGRVGRVSNGRVYRLVPMDFYTNCMERKTIPEILRASLEHVVLQTKILQFSEEPKGILALAINPPNLSNIETTIWRLKECGAMLMTCRGRKHLSDGDLTFLGTVMASLPMDIYLAKFVVLGHMFSVLHEAVIIAAGCSIRNIFSAPYNQRFQAYNKKLLWADGSCSDLLALLNLYNVWQAYKRENHFKNQNDEYSWCKTNFVSLKGLREWQLLITEITCRLKRLGIEETSGQSRVVLSHTEKSTILKVITCGAFYPNYFIRAPGSGQVDEREAVKTVGGRDPYRTVYMTGFDPGQPGQLYVRDIKKMLEIKDNVTVGFDGTSKIYIEFKTYREPEVVNVDGEQIVTTIPGKIAMNVYQAVRKRQLGMNFMLNILPKDKAWDYVESRKQLNNSESEVMNCFSPVDYSAFPSLDTEYITVTISMMVDAGHFWCQNWHDGTQEMLNNINLTINRTPLKPINIHQISPDKLYAAKYKEDQQYYRCKLQIVLSKETIQIIFVDYGNIEVIRVKELCELPDGEELQVVPLAIECVLSEIQPSLVLNPKGLWSDKINAEFGEQTRGIILYGKVYSVVDDVVHLDLFRKLPNKGASSISSINQWLIEKGYAQKVEESFLSKENHEKRLYVLKSDNPNGEAVKLGNDKLRNYTDYEPPEDNVKKYMKPIVLKGPFSPLEMKVYGVMAQGENKQVDIEPSSVNTVLLDNDPQTRQARFIVASSANQTATGKRLILRQTSVMPAIPGFPVKMTLLFCPIMEPKVTEDGSRVASILCGLGCHEHSNKPCFRERDMVLNLDTDLTGDVINSVNELRYAMSMAMKTMFEVYESECQMKEVEEIQRTIKLKLYSLLQLKMNMVEPIFIEHTHVWGRYLYDCEMLKPPVIADVHVWPLHWYVKVNTVEEKSALLHKNLVDLQLMAKKITPFTNTSCDICDILIDSLGDLRKHLISAVHKEKQKAVPQD